MPDDSLIPQTHLSSSPRYEEFKNNLAQVATATMMAQSLSFCLERKYLSMSEPFSLLQKAEASLSLQGTKWIRITQIGRPVNENLSACFDAIQNILKSCTIPKTTLLFLVTGNGKSFSIFMGLKGDELNCNDFQTDVSSFMNISWTGLSCHPVYEKNKDGEISADYSELKSFLASSFTCVNAITGIPTLNLQNNYPGTIEMLLGGIRHDKMAYLVVAEPIPQERIENAIDSCLEMQGQAESVKSFSFADSFQQGTSSSISEAHSITDSQAQALGDSRKDRKSIYAALGVGAVALASGIAFPAVKPFVDIAQVLAAPVSLGGLGGVGVISALIPQKTITDTKQHGETDTNTKTKGESENYSKSLTKNLVNGHVSNIVEHLKAHKERLELGKATGLWRVGCYLFSDAGSSTSPLQLKALLCGADSVYEPIRIHDVSRFVPKASRHEYKGFILPPFIECVVNGKTRFEHPFGDDYASLSTVLTTKELSCFINLPLHSVPGINVVEASPDFSLSKQVGFSSQAISIGRLLWSGSSTDIDIKLPLDVLSRHALVAGVNGSGKTNTVLSVLDGFLESKRPFLVIEPAKTEYVDWAVDYNNKYREKHPGEEGPIRIFMPGCRHYAKKDLSPDILRINPFEVIRIDEQSEFRVLSHIDRLKSTFAAAFPMQDILPVVMEHLLYDLYTTTNPMIDASDPLYLKKGFPTLSTVDRDFIKDLMRNIGYAQENTQNISAALKTRFESLKFGWKGELLNNEHISGISWSELFGKPCVINLSFAGDDQDRAFIMSLILQFLYEYRIAESESKGFDFNNNSCRHLVVVEEAHRVMSRCENPELPQYKSGMMFSNFLSEVRAYGQGMMIVDQVPIRLIEDAIKNTNVKIIHKLVASDDARVISESIGLTLDQQRVIPKLSIGQAVISGVNSAAVASENSSDVYLAQIKPMK